MTTYQDVVDKSQILLSLKDMREFGRSSLEFIEMLRQIEFTDSQKEGKEETLKDAQSIFGFHSYHPSEETRKHVIKEIRGLLHCIKKD